MTKDLSVALEYFLKSAELGHTDAQCHVASAYYYGTYIFHFFTNFGLKIRRKVLIVFNR